MMVVDASVLVNAIGDDEQAGAIARSALSGVDLSVPDLVDVEVMSVLRRRWLAGDLSEMRFAQAVEDLATLPAVRYPIRYLMGRAFELRANVTPYDASYVALAEALDCVLLTADSRLALAPGLRCEVRVMSA